MCLTLAVVWPAAALADDWAAWRGPEQTGFARQPAPITKWTPGGENQLWKIDVGGRSTPIVMNGRVFLVGPVGAGECLQERVVCVDGTTGRTLWERRFNVFLTDIVKNRVGWPSLVGDPETGFVYCHGTGGEMMCFDANGTLQWERAMTEEFNRVSGYGGRIHTPVIDEDRLLISMVSSSWGTHGPPGHYYAALDKRTGEVIWWSKPGGRHLDTTYSVPFITVINGRRMIIAGNADGNVYGMLARTGEKVWEFKLAKRGLNTSVVCDGKYAYISHSEENLDTTVMGRVVCIDASMTGDITEKGEVWRYDGCQAGYASPALANGRLYVVDNSAHLFCFDAKSGKLHWTFEMGRVGKGSPVVTKDGVIYCGTVNGRFLIMKDLGDKCEMLDETEFTRDDDLVVEIFGSPAVADGRIFFMTRYETYALGNEDTSPPAVDIPALPDEKPVQEDKPAHLQVVPAEVTLAPGEQVQFLARLFDANGRLIGVRKAKWSPVDVKGEFHPTGTFIAADHRVFSAGLVKAEVDGLTGTARVRVGPSIPFFETFDKMKTGSVPPGWIGVGGKSVLVEQDGNVVLRKNAENPSVPFMRMRAFSGPPISDGYTVVADIKADLSSGRRPTLPDVGLINSRYLLIAKGREQELWLESWTPIPRISKRLPFEWKHDVWYRLKLRVDIIGNDGLVRGKVWSRGEQEPVDWMIEIRDPCPNTEGSPGLYAYSLGTTPRKQGAMSYYDNYRVFKND